MVQDMYGQNMHRSQALQSLRNVFPKIQLNTIAYPLSGDKSIELWGLNPDSFPPPYDDSQLRFLEDNPPYWSTVWPAARALISHIENSKINLENLCVLDFGAGSGVLSLFCAMHGADVHAVDIVPDCCEAIEANARLNGLSIRVSQSVPEHKFDLCFVPDVLYDNDVHSILNSVLENQPIVYVADCLRREYTHWNLEPIATESYTTWPQKDQLNYHTVKIWKSKSLS
jgi:predicted nicotinamide N-methyase